MVDGTWKRVDRINEFVNWDTTNSLEGILINKETVLGVDGKPNFIYTVEVSPDLKKKFFGTIVLNDLLKDLLVGCQLCIVNKGKQKRTRLFEVYTR